MRKRRLPSLVTAAAALFLFMQAARATAEHSQANATVREERGVYTVVARFPVDQPASAVLAVLTDYEQIPRFMPDVRTSIVRERTTGRAVVEQEAGQVAEYLIRTITMPSSPKRGEMTSERPSSA
jgi:uncharacterized membrane protein